MQARRLKHRRPCTDYLSVRSPPLPAMPAGRAELQRKNTELAADLKAQQKKNRELEQALANNVVQQEKAFKMLPGSVKAAVYKLKVKKGIVKEAHAQSRPLSGVSKLTKLSSTGPPIAAPPPPTTVDPKSSPSQSDAHNNSMIEQLRGRSSR